MTSFPPAPSAWERVDPKDAGFDPAALKAAVAHAVASETEWPESLHAATARGVFEPPPWNEPLGPFKDRGHVNGLHLKVGKVVAQWGTPARDALTFRHPKK